MEIKTAQEKKIMSLTSISEKKNEKIIHLDSKKYSNTK